MMNGGDNARHILSYVFRTGIANGGEFYIRPPVTADWLPAFTCKQKNIQKFSVYMEMTVSAAKVESA
jgi:hypothetical protein